MSTRSNRFFAVFLAAFLVAACGQGSAGPAASAEAPAAVEPITVRIGTQPWIGYGPWWIAKEKGMFEKYGLQAELVDFLEDKEVNAAFASGDMDAANLATHTAIKLYASGLDLKIILLEDASYEADAILAPSAVTSIADLAGRKIAYEEGTTSDLLLNYALSQNGMSIDDIEPIFMPASDAGATLIAGQVDVAVTYEPYISAALAGDSDLKLLYSAAERPGLISDVLAVRSGLDPKVATSLIQVWDEALAFYKDSPDEAKAIIAAAVGSTPGELQTAFDGVQFYGLAENQAELSGEFAKTLKDVAEVARSIGLFEEIPDLSAIVDTSVYPR